MLGAISDISRYGRRREDRYALLRGDARVLLPSVGEQDVAVFSPPYPNSFDYTDVYNVELWLLGYFRNGESNRSLRGKTLRSHVQIKRSYAVSLDMPQSLKSTYSELVKHREALWSRYIPEMVVSYFDDMANVLKGVSKPLRKRGRIYCVVGDSQYAGVAIPVAKILKQLVCSTALKLVYSEQFRSMRVSPQQGGREELPETLLVFEKG